MTTAPPSAAPTILEAATHLRRLRERANRRQTSLCAGDLDALGVVLAAVALIYGAGEPVAGEGA